MNQDIFGDGRFIIGDRYYDLEILRFTVGYPDVCLLRGQSAVNRFGLPKYQPGWTESYDHFAVIRDDGGYMKRLREMGLRVPYFRGQSYLFHDFNKPVYEVLLDDTAMMTLRLMIDD